MIVYLVRHALAGQHGDPRYPDDALRPLTKEGRKRFQAVCEVLAARGVAPALIATSPLVRCRQTAEILAAALGEASLVELEDLTPGGSLEAIVSWTHRQGPQDVAWVGHAPDVENHLATLLGQAPGGIRFAKGAVAAVEFDGEVAAGAGQLRWLVTAKVLGC